MCQHPNQTDTILQRLFVVGANTTAIYQDISGGGAARRGEGALRLEASLVNNANLARPQHNTRHVGLDVTVASLVTRNFANELIF